MKIPSALEQVLVENRKKLNTDARQINSGYNLEIMATSPENLNEELRFWEIENDEEMENFVLTELYDALFDIKGHHKWKHCWNELPAGYSPLFEIMDFERGYQSEGWYFVENIGIHTFDLVIRAKRFYKLDTEVNALSAVKKQYVKLELDNDEEMDDLDTVLSEAYYSVENHLSDFDDQLAVICKFIRGNLEFFSERE